MQVHIGRTLGVNLQPFKMLLWQRPLTPSGRPHGAFMLLQVTTVGDGGLALQVATADAAWMKSGGFCMLCFL